MTDPEGKPTVRIGNVSSTSIEIIWTPPPRNTMHGEFLGFKLRYWLTGDANNVKEIIYNTETRVSFFLFALI